MRKAWIFAAVLLGMLPLPAQAERIKDIATLQGVRSNQLIGYGLVVGLDGTGDQTTQTPFTVQSLKNMLTQLGVNLPAGTTLQLKNVAAVTVTANLPPFARPGQTIDVTVSSMGNANSLRGGTLLLTPLKGANGQVYAMAQGSLIVGGYGAAGAGASVQVNSTRVARIPNGATVEQAVPTQLGQGDMLNLDLNSPDFTTANRVSQAINAHFGPDTAQALNAGQIQVRAPLAPGERVNFIAALENLTLTTGEPVAKVIIDARSGTVVLGQNVRLRPAAVAHGNLSVTISERPQVSQPNPFGRGQTVVTPGTSIATKEEKGRLMLFPAGVTLETVVRALNAVGATPTDLVAILQAMKLAGALQAELEVV
ncbi:MAG: flagellar basal body P-ring protein FlgI [Pseudomonadota bacterium]|uniref:flagellar basal body P-ring protein FlgI n=1 Tax=Thermithiobacillus tepidarius TaxID=929 RepID=UPI0004075147|nr:flagellar basal body P-ring protein FlgI [Thermithiobacillus tepidarius]